MGNGCRVTNRITGESFTCSEGLSVLKAMEQEGVQCVPVGCRGGGCGFCKIRVVEGKYECGKMSRAHAPPEAIEQGEVLACRIYPVTDLTIECLEPSIPGKTSEQTTTKAMR